MSGYAGRRGINVSHYIASLNEVSPQEPRLDSPTNIDEDLALFTNTEFVDWDGGNGFEQNPATLNSIFEQPTTAQDTSASEPKMDFNFDSNFQFADFNFQAPIVEQSMQALPHPQPSTYSVAPTFASPANAAVSPVTPGFDPASGKKRKLSAMDHQSQRSIDEAARHAAEEDKRRRNTAASARFRIKKKQREQALEKTAKEMSERVSVLETRIQQLETENTWLKSLITEKSGGKTPSADIGAMLRKHVADAGERISGNRNDGVGTKGEETKA